MAGGFHLVSVSFPHFCHPPNTHTHVKAHSNTHTLNPYIGLGAMFHRLREIPGTHPWVGSWQHNPGHRPLNQKSGDHLEIGLYTYMFHYTMREELLTPFTPTTTFLFTTSLTPWMFEQDILSKMRKERKIKVAVHLGSERHFTIKACFQCFCAKVCSYCNICVCVCVKEYVI